MRKFVVALCCLTSIICAETVEVKDPASRHPIRVYADIVGDLMHMGHVEFFKQAKSQGDILVIGVLSDETVASYKRVPIMTMEERAAVIGACKYVDEVVLDPPLRLTEEWIRAHNIDLVVHGDDFNRETLEDQYGVALRLGIFRAVPYTRGISTTDLIGRIVARQDELLERALVPAPEGERASNEGAVQNP